MARVLFISTFIALLAFAFTAADPVFLYTPVNLGGVGFQPELIAAAIALNGVSQALWLLLVFPPLQHRIGTGGVLRVCAVAWPFFLAAHSLANALLRNNLKAAFWTLFPVATVIGSGVAMSFSTFSHIMSCAICS